jgi:hypothetical protein
MQRKYIDSVPCQLGWQKQQVGSSGSLKMVSKNQFLARNLLHLPDKPAGVRIGRASSD